MSFSKQNSKVLASPFISRQKNPQKQNKFFEIFASNLQRRRSSFLCVKEMCTDGSFYIFSTEMVWSKIEREVYKETIFVQIVKRYISTSTDYWCD